MGWKLFGTFWVGAGVGLCPGGAGTLVAVWKRLVPVTPCPILICFSFRYLLLLFIINFSGGLHWGETILTPFRTWRAC